MEDEFSDQLNKKLRSPRVVLAVLFFCTLILLFLFFYLYRGTSDAIDRTGATVLQDIKLTHGSAYVTAHETNYLYRYGSRELSCTELSSGVADGLDLEKVQARMQFIHEHDRAPCVCAPQTGTHVQLMLVIQDNITLWMHNPALIRLSYFSPTPTEVTWSESSSLYPNAAPVDVVRWSIVNVQYLNRKCEREERMYTDKLAACVAGCIQLFEGKTVYDLQTK